MMDLSGGNDMEYTVNRLAKLAGISSRTLRYYDEINILKPARSNSSGYRIYGEAQVDQLQQIMFYRELGIELESIKKLMNSAGYSKIDALKEHHEKLLDRKKQLDLLIDNVEKTIAKTEGRYSMSDKEKFEGFKNKMIEDNELKYGKEIREKYGEERINASNQKLKNMSQEQYTELEKLSEEVNDAIRVAFKKGDPASDLAQKACSLHKEWLSYYWPQYSKEAHMGLAQMYVDDERFTAYYDKIAPGCAVFLRDAMRIYTGLEQ